MVRRTALVCGGGGFIGHHLIKQYKKEGYWVRGVGRKHPEFEPSEADEFILADLRKIEEVKRALTRPDGPFDEICQMAATIGPINFIAANKALILHDSALIHLNILEECRKTGAKKILYPSSAFVYPEYNPIHSKFSESSAYPANPPTEYGWEKLFGEQLCKAYQNDYGMDFRIVRLHNVFGVIGPWNGGREKAPAAFCRKIAEVEDGGEIEIWGNGLQTRSFLYIDECIEGLRRIMLCPHPLPVLNLGSEELISINDLALMIARIAHKTIRIKNIPGQVGPNSRNSDNTLIQKVLNWKPSKTLETNLKTLYPWIREQVRHTNLSK